MKACYLAAVVLLVAAPAGCAGRRHDMDQLERELRYLEDKVFQLEYANQECGQQLKSAQLENESLLRDSASKSGTPAKVGSQRGSAKARRGAADEPDLNPPVVELPDGEGAPPFEGPPEIQPPGPDVHEGEPGDGVPPDGESAMDDSTSESGPPPRAHRGQTKTKPRGESVPRREPAPPFKEKTADLGPGEGDEPGPQDGPGRLEGTVRQITLNRRLTGGHDIDGAPGDEGLMVVVEPLDAEGELIEVAGDISVVVLDPAQQGEGARVARWDYTAAQAAHYLKRTPLGDGLHFTMRWPHSPPVNRTLNLYVKYTTPDGRELQAEKQIEIDPPGELANKGNDWTPAPARASESIADDDESGTPSDLPRGRAKAVRPLPADGDGDANSSDSPQTTRRGVKRSSRGPKWSPYR